MTAPASMQYDHAMDPPSPCGPRPRHEPCGPTLGRPQLYGHKTAYSMATPCGQPAYLLGNLALQAHLLYTLPVQPRQGRGWAYPPHIQDWRPPSVPVRIQEGLLEEPRSPTIPLLGESDPQQVVHQQRLRTVQWNTGRSSGRDSVPTKDRLDAG